MRIDFHAHILPGMDHGCDDADMAREQLKRARENKVDLIVATSHFYPHVHTVEGYIRSRDAAMDLLRKTIEKEQGMPMLLPGAEVLVCNRMDRMPGLERLCIGDSNLLLLELPFSRKWDRALVETVIRIHNSNNIRVILAHADRYPYEAVMELVNNGIDIQLNVESVCSLLKRGHCRKYIQTDRVVALGSDIHGISNAYKSYSRAIKILGVSANVILNRTQELMNISG